MKKNRKETSSNRMAAAVFFDSNEDLRIGRIEIFLVLMSLLILSGCSPQSAEGPETTTASETPDSTAHAPATEHEGGPVHWSYGEDDGPANWAALSSDYSTCASGREQSPIDIAAITTADPLQGSRNYQAATLKIIRHEHVADLIDKVRVRIVRSTLGRRFGSFPTDRSDPCTSEGRFGKAVLERVELVASSRLLHLVFVPV